MERGKTSYMPVAFNFSGILESSFVVPTQQTTLESSQAVTSKGHSCTYYCTSVEQIMVRGYSCNIHVVSNNICS